MGAAAGKVAKTFDKRGRSDSRAALLQETQEWDARLEADFPAVVPVTLLPEEDNYLFDTELVGHKAKEAMLRNNYQILSQSLGTGSFGAVYLGLSINGHVAVKVFNVNKLMTEWRANFIRSFPRELSIIKRLDHPNIVKTHQIYLQMSSGRVYIFMEKALYNLMHHLKMVMVRVPTEDEAKQMFRQIAAGLNYMHSHNWSHRDIKPPNCLVFGLKDSTIKITDFGYARSVIDPTIGQRTMSETYNVVTPNFRPPEIFMQVPFDPLACDVWSLGVTLFLVVTKTLPFMDPDVRAGRVSKKETDFTKVLEEQLQMNYEFPPNQFISDPLKSLIEGMLQAGPLERLTMPQVLAHQWLTPRKLTKKYIRN